MPAACYNPEDLDARSAIGEDVESVLLFIYREGMEDDCQLSREDRAHFVLSIYLVGLSAGLGRKDNRPDGLAACQPEAVSSPYTLRKRGNIPGVQAAGVFAG
eukprot:scaffold89372_cov49-Prasinocladus_malaysianus.AAC.2